MSVTLRHPFRLDAAGSAITIKQGTERHALEIARHIIACRIGERNLAPEWGISDPLADGIDEGDVLAAVDLCDPDIAVTNVSITPRPDDEGVDITVDAVWRP